ncbi:D-TA family PLP-dependent enzyme [Flagellimonas zhangzhouensis]|uniref:D-serine deaminase, pyridoxal phosphate-dependent n=1 Tax=Flagellimonas zhangzhouensis TaxID=1073328 RepID=A0A1H2VCW6_9FLAO|nr:D-TA family PLP-dependent enzyme [Allomuricauda zhangzhouensis]SDQ08902.1 D-serine deaminase, pyridoxal phosphate-dependent [Allomuricauda zhangzhouensis]SDW66070.1 D-serine deaminase, pyridoxal phosphate-dependent [Allomuricauda zhangzhouensis]
MKNWYEIENIETVDSPSIVLYLEHLKFNIEEMISLVDGNTERLMPHIKTNKMPKVMALLIDSGISHFKASTIAEAEIAAEASANSVLIAHQLVGPKVKRFLQLIKYFPDTQFSTLLDNTDSAELLDQLATDEKVTVPIYIDINNGMNRSGIKIGEGLDDLMAFLNTCKALEFKGFHVYDGHLRDPEFAVRNEKIETGLKDVSAYFKAVREKYQDAQMICGGTPSFTSHLIEKNRITSPGTCVLWDWGYGEKLTEQKFKTAALLVTRVISKPTEGIITVDLGHKSVAAENPIDKRVKFLNLEDYELLSQSEEHGVIKVKDWDNYKVGDVFYGVPYHICPTINLHDEVSVIENGKKVATWEITARKRKLQF